MKKASLIFLFILEFSTLGSVVDYCFAPATSLSLVHSHLTMVLSLHDEVIENNSSHCLNVVVKNNFKEELYRKWILRKFKILSTNSSTAVLSHRSLPPRIQEHCRLEIEKVSWEKETTRGVDISRRSGVYEKNFKHSGSQKSSLLLGVGISGSLRVNDEYINVICKSRNAYRVFLDIALTGEKSSVATSVTIERGRRVDLASIVEDLNDKFKNISLRKGIRVEKTKGQKMYQYYLRVKE